MAVTLIIGSQWGDEGKGKVIDFLSPTTDFVVRFHGGNNAGHTVVNDYGKFPMHLVPSGIFNNKAVGLITNGVVIDLEVLVLEIDMLEKAGINLKDRLFVSPRAHIIMPYHKLLDALYEDAKGKNKTGTTGRGIGPVYADKVSYNGIRLWDLMDPKKFSEKLEVQLSIKNKTIEALGGKTLSLEKIEEVFLALRKQVLPFIREPYPMLAKALKENKNILLEGAQAVFLDNDWGTYPYVTASTVVAGGITSQAGVPPQKLDEVIGIAKAYATRVGAGPFPTELTDDIGEKLRKAGNEYGTTTGRPRRCGWFDAELIRFAAELNGYSCLALTKLDILDEFDEIYMCTGYELNGKKVAYYEGDATFLSEVKPVYKKMPGWKSTTRGATKYEDLPQNARDYIEEIEKQTGVSIKYVSTGPERSAIIVR